MISYLSGKIVDIESNKIILFTSGGIGYDVWLSDICLLELTTNIEKNFYIYHHITDSSQLLFGFLEKFEKQIFEELIKISGIGGKLAITILSLGLNNLINAIGTSDNKIIESIKGVGKKMAEKIIIELKDKDFVKNISFSNNNDYIEANNKLEKSLQEDILSTLINMGYDKNSIENAISKIGDESSTMDQIIPAIIKKIG